MRKFLCISGAAIALSMNAYSAYECKSPTFTKTNENIQKHWETLMEIKKVSSQLSPCIEPVGEITVTPGKKKNKIFGKPEGYRFTIGEAKILLFDQIKDTDKPILTVNNKEPITIETSEKGDQFQVTMKEDVHQFNAILHDDEKDITVTLKTAIDYNFTYDQRLKIITKRQSLINQTSFDLHYPEMEAGEVIQGGIDQMSSDLSSQTRPEDTIISFHDQSDVKNIWLKREKTEENTIKEMTSLNIDHMEINSDVKDMDSTFLGLSFMNQCGQSMALQEEEDDILPGLNCLFQFVKGKKLGSGTSNIKSTDIKIASEKAESLASLGEVNLSFSGAEQDGLLNVGIQLSVDDININDMIRDDSVPQILANPKKVMYRLDLKNISKDKIDQTATLEEFKLAGIDSSLKIEANFDQSASINADASFKFDENSSMTLSDMPQLENLIMAMPNDYDLSVDITTVNQSLLIKDLKQAGIIGTAFRFFGEKQKGDVPTYKYHFTMEDGNPIINGKKIPSFLLQ